MSRPVERLCTLPELAVVRGLCPERAPIEMATPAALSEISDLNRLQWRTPVTAPIGAQRDFSELANLPAPADLDKLCDSLRIVAAR
jgi:hypothetical protein